MIDETLSGLLSFAEQSVNGRTLAGLLGLDDGSVNGAITLLSVVFSGST